VTTLGIIIGMGVVTYAIRLVPLLLLGRITLPPLILQALRYVPVAVLSAIAVPELLQPAGTPGAPLLFLSLANYRLLAGVVAILLAWRTRNVLLTIAGGMATLWLLNWLAG
jgi:branched-subunit amino acid transport protein